MLQIGAQILAIGLFLFLGFDLLRRGMAGITRKEMIAFRWGFVGSEVSNQDLDVKSGKWVRDYEKVIRGKSEIFFGVIYSFLGTILLISCFSVFWFFSKF